MVMTISKRAARLNTDGQLIIKRKKTGVFIKEAVIARNISSSGISFETKAFFEIGEQLEIAIKFGEVIVKNNLVKVVRAEKQGLINIYGCTFVKIVDVEVGGQVKKIKGAVSL